MGFLWVFIESLAILVENLVFVYFLNSRFISKQKCYLPQVLTWASLSVLGHVIVFSDIHFLVYDSGSTLVMFAFLFSFKHGKIWMKILCVVITQALILGTTVLGTTVVTLMTDASFADIRMYQDSSRMIALMLVKAIQLILFFTLARWRKGEHNIKKTTAFLFIFLISAIISSIIIIYTALDGFNDTQNIMLVLLSVGLLMIMLVVFLLYELFLREEAKNLSLTINLQRKELESKHFDEIDAVYADIRKLHHEYYTNLTMLAAYIKGSNLTKALDHVNGLVAELDSFDNLLKTGNVVLDAVVSSKLSYARSNDVDIDIHAVYPSDSEIQDKDLCAIIGNLLDNATEACLRMTGEERRKFISFSLLAKGKNMVITIGNSFEGAIKKKGDRYITSKKKHSQGIGMEYVDLIVEKNNGHILRAYENGIFTTFVMLPLKPPRERRI
jgi:hypothetical protein